MLFSSIIFLFYFLPIVMVLYYTFKFSRKLQNFILLISSLIFYAWGEPRFVIIMILSIILNYIFGLLIHVTKRHPVWKRIVLVTTIVVNIGNLFAFKYLTFFLSELKEISGFKQLDIPEILLPIGISFFTFQAMSYVIDVYRGTTDVQKNIFHLGLYISLFPQLIAGPIVRYSTLAVQLTDRKESWRMFSIGCMRFLTGLAKKIIIANNMAIVADQIFAMSSNGTIPATLAWVGALAYTLQIFFDFSAYSDMAIGLGLMFGFKFDENFKYPYLSKSISEFWRRWHISLGMWFRDYVYIPLGGSRVSSKDKVIRNLLVVWVLTGIWHGANWTFVFWGLMNFCFIAIEKTINFEKLRIPNWTKHLYAMLIIVIGWVIFRSNNLQEAGTYINYMFGNSGFTSDTAFMFIKEFSVFFLAAIIFSFPIAKKINHMNIEKSFPLMTWLITILYPITMMGLFIICLTYLVKGSYNPFIYFNF